MNVISESILRQVWLYLMRDEITVVPRRKATVVTQVGGKCLSLEIKVFSFILDCITERLYNF